MKSRTPGVKTASPLPVIILPTPLPIPTPLPAAAPPADDGVGVGAAMAFSHWRRGDSKIRSDNGDKVKVGIAVIQTYRGVI